MGRKHNGSRGVLGRRYFFWAGYRAVGIVIEFEGLQGRECVCCGL